MTFSRTTSRYANRLLTALGAMMALLTAAGCGYRHAYYSQPVVVVHHYGSGGYGYGGGPTVVHVHHYGSGYTGGRTVVVHHYH